MPEVVLIQYHVLDIMEDLMIAFSHVFFPFPLLCVCLATAAATAP